LGELADTVKGIATDGKDWATLLAAGAGTTWKELLGDHGITGESEVGVEAAGGVCKELDATTSMKDTGSEA
jgi:hypothetical protein